jgi:hypothetical protein
VLGGRLEGAWYYDGPTPPLSPRVLVVPSDFCFYDSLLEDSKPQSKRVVGQMVSVLVMSCVLMG